MHAGNAQIANLTEMVFEYILIWIKITKIRFKCGPVSLDNDEFAKFSELSIANDVGGRRRFAAGCPLGPSLANRFWAGSLEPRVTMEAFELALHKSAEGATEDGDSLLGG